MSICTRCTSPYAHFESAALQLRAGLLFHEAIQPFGGSTSCGCCAVGRASSFWFNPVVSALNPFQSHFPVPHDGRSGSTPAARIGYSPEWMYARCWSSTYSQLNDPVR